MFSLATGRGLGTQTGPSPGLVAPERPCHEVAEAREEIDAHSGMEAIGIVAADGKEADLRIVTERNQCSRAYVVCVFTKQEVALAVANLAAASGTAGEERLERTEFLPTPC